MGLKDFMRQAGEVNYTNTHQNRSGEGVAEFGSRGDMEYALDKLDGAELGGRRIRIFEEGKGGGGGGRGRSRSRSRSRSSPRRSRRSRTRSRSRSKYRVIVENLSSSTSWQDLKDFMRQAG